MSIQTIKATIQMRRGLEEDFDSDQMTAGEWAVSTDTRYVRMCFAPGIVLRMATYEAFEEDMREIQTILATCQDIQVAVEMFEELAEQHKNDAAGSALLSESWAHGGTGIREDESEDNSKYWSKQSKSEADRAKKEADRAEAIVGFEIDSSLSETSVNPVQNRVVTEELNKKLNKDGDASNVNAVFSQSTSRVNIASGEKLSVTLGKIQKFFADLKTAAFTGSYNDLLNKPSIPKVINNLSSTSTTDALSAVQGKNLYGYISTINDIMTIDHKKGTLKLLVNSNVAESYTIPQPIEFGFYLVVINVAFDISSNAITVLNVNCDDGQGQYTVRSTMSGGGGMNVTRIFENTTSKDREITIGIYQGHTASVTATVKYEYIRIPVKYI